MKIKIPDMKAVSCLDLHLCGQLDKGQDAIIEWMTKRKKNVLAPMKQSRRTVYVGIRHVNTKPDHIHFDVIAKLGRKPRELSESKDVEAELKILDGARVALTASGRFVLPIEMLPATGLIRRDFFAVSGEGFAIRKSTSSFSISGAPISGIDWVLFDDDPASIGIQVSAVLDAVIDENYFTKHLDLVASGVRAFALAERMDVENRQSAT